MTKTFQDVTQYLQVNLESGSCEIAPTFPGVTALDYLMQLKKILSLILLKNDHWKKRDFMRTVTISQIFLLNFPIVDQVPC